MDLTYDKFYAFLKYNCKNKFTFFVCKLFTYGESIRAADLRRPCESHNEVW